MGWVHRHKRHGALLALAALALQFVLAFGHVHLNDVHLNNVHPNLAGASRPASAASHNNVLAQASPQAPAQNPGGDDDYCAICASIFLASTSFTPAPPALPVPLGFRRIEHSFDNAQCCAEPRRFAFQSRAPPAA
jgi:hypothetical protein